MKNIHITRIILKGFKGFKTSSISIADIKMVKKLQQLISTNGSGKSTFLSELSLSPINKDLFRKGGGKVVEFIADGKKYIFKSNHKGHILIDAETGKQLTQGETITHYLELVKTMFGYTDYKWKLVTGQLRFTAMSRADRQKWIETISGIDFTYPFRIYAAIKNGITGVKRAIKEYDAELANSADKVLSAELRLEKEDRRTKLGEVISEIIAKKDSTPDAAKIQDKINVFRQLDDELAETKVRILDGEQETFAHLNVSSIDEFRESYLNDTVRLDNIDVEFKAKEKELREKVELRNKLSTKDTYDINKARVELFNKEAELEELVDLTGSSFIDSYADGLKHYAVNKDEIIQNINLEVMGKLGGDSSIVHTLSKEKQRSIAQRLESISSEVRKHKDTLAHLDELILTTKNGKDISCPKCNAIFKDGEQNLGSLQQRRKETAEDLELLERDEFKLTEVMNDVKVIESNKQILMNIIGKHITLGEVRNPIQMEINNNAALDCVMIKLEHNLEIARNSFRIICLRKEVTALKDAIQYHEGLAKLGSVEDYQNQCDELEQQLVDIRDRRTKLNEEIKQKASDGKRLRAYVDRLDKFDDLISRHQAALTDLKNTLYASAVGRLLEDLQVELGKITNDLTNDTITLGIRSKLGKLVNENKAKLKVLIDLETAINPSTGLIAEQLTAYCRLFSGYTTQILSQIWGYDMQVLEPIVHPTRGVNYRFPMTIMDDEVIADISCGSTSQKSIIDLAITMASRELLSANGQLLMLDEVGGGFDTIHNISLGEFLYELITESPSKNILVIHHDQNIRAGLGDCDTIVFDPTQVVVDEGYNEHVTLKYA